eukprot:g16095.t1
MADGCSAADVVFRSISLRPFLNHPGLDTEGVAFHKPIPVHTSEATGLTAPFEELRFPSASPASPRGPGAAAQRRRERGAGRVHRGVPGLRPTGLETETSRATRERAAPRQEESTSVPICIGQVDRRTWPKRAKQGEELPRKIRLTYPKRRHGEPDDPRVFVPAHRIGDAPKRSFLPVSDRKDDRPRRHSEKRSFGHSSLPCLSGKQMKLHSSSQPVLKAPVEKSSLANAGLLQFMLPGLGFPPLAEEVAFEELFQMSCMNDPEVELDSQLPWGELRLPSAEAQFAPVRADVLDVRALKPAITRCPTSSAQSPNISIPSTRQSRSPVRFRRVLMQGRQRSDRRSPQQPSRAPEAAEAAPHERAAPVGAAPAGATSAQATPPPYMPQTPSSSELLDVDVTVLAFAQWVMELKHKSSNSQRSLQTELNTIKTAINGNHTDLAEFKRQGASIQQRMQCEINEIRESLSSVFMEITAADLKMKIQTLNEQAVRNETAFAQLADAADQSQSKLRAAAQEMQHSSERMREDMASLNQQTDFLQTQVTDRSDQLRMESEQLAQDLHTQLEKRKVQLQKMVQDVVNIGESLQGLVNDFGHLRKESGTNQSKLQKDLFSQSVTGKVTGLPGSTQDMRLYHTSLASRWNYTAPHTAKTTRPKKKAQGSLGAISEAAEWAEQSTLDTSGEPSTLTAEVDALWAEAGLAPPEATSHSAREGRPACAARKGGLGVAASQKGSGTSSGGLTSSAEPPTRSAERSPERSAPSAKKECLPAVESSEGETSEEEVEVQHFSIPPRSPRTEVEIEVELEVEGLVEVSERKPSSEPRTGRLTALKGVAAPASPTRAHRMVARDDLVEEALKARKPTSEERRSELKDMSCLFSS